MGGIGRGQTPSALVDKGQKGHSPTFWPYKNKGMFL